MWGGETLSVRAGSRPSSGGGSRPCPCLGRCGSRSRRRRRSNSRRFARRNFNPAENITEGSMHEFPRPWSIKYSEMFGNWGILAADGSRVTGLTSRYNKDIAERIVLWANAEDIQRRRGGTTYRATIRTAQIGGIVHFEACDAGSKHQAMHYGLQDVCCRSHVEAGHPRAGRSRTGRTSDV